MAERKIFDKYRSRLRREGIVKSAMYGLIAGSCANFLCALFSWIFAFDAGWWLALILLAAVWACVACALYFVKFRPTDARIARRVDRELGLDERTVTMLEFERSDSYLARRQREDACERLTAASMSKLSLALSTLLIAATPIAAAVGGSMTAVSALAARNVIPYGMQIADPDSRFDFVSVTYFVDEGGEIDGEADQIMERGENAEGVLAVAEDGWIFVGWDDGVKTPYREDFDIREDLFFTALFEPIEGAVDDDDDAPIGGGGGEQGDIDAPPDQPGNENGGESGSPGDGGNADGGDGQNSTDGTGENGDQGVNGGKGQGTGAGGQYAANNQVIDGNTYYATELEFYREELSALISSDDGTLTDEDKAFIEKYFAGL